MKKIKIRMRAALVGDVDTSREIDATYDAINLYLKEQTRAHGIKSIELLNFEPTKFAPLIDWEMFRVIAITEHGELFAAYSSDRIGLVKFKENIKE